MSRHRFEATPNANCCLTRLTPDAQEPQGAQSRRHDLAEAEHQHAMRHRGVMELAWAGCDDDEIASYGDHASKAMIIKYAGVDRQIMRAKHTWKKRQ